MKTNDEDRWYIRGKKGCTEQIRKEFIKRGADDPNLEEMNFEEKTYLYHLVCGFVFIEGADSTLGKRIVKQWNEVTVSEPKPKPMFNPFDKVLMCDGEGEGEKAFWLATEFACYTQYPEDGYRYRAISSRVYRYCIPYLGNEELNNKRFSFDHIRGYE